MQPIYRKARFLSSAFDLHQLVEDRGREVAFAGRSNAGKSTAINSITQHKNLCKTSKTPGRTQLINFFEIDKQTRLVDLPGYGFAKVPLKMRQHWDRVLSGYLIQRHSLCGLMIVMDIRRGLTQLDLGLIELVDTQLPIHLLLTKADKLNKWKKADALSTISRQTENGDISSSVFSALTGEGREDVWKKLDEWLAQGESDREQEKPAVENQTATKNPTE